MSDNSDCGSEEKYTNGVREDNICRDFLRNVCKRGKRCKYRHPDNGETKELGRRHEYTFCHDFQNTGCRRSTCKFLHCTREEEEYHKQTGQLPVRLQQAAALGIGVAPKELPLLRGEVPICKDYLNGECKRGAKCKFRHVAAADYDFDVRKSDHSSRCRSHSKLYDPYEDEYDRYDRYDYDHMSLKRRRSEYEYESRYARPLSYQLLEDENLMLRRKVEDLKKQVADLTATNEVLLEQNARYRVSKSNLLQAVTSACSPVSQPISVSQPLTTVVTPAPAVAAAAPTPGPQPCSHMNTSLTQQLALKCDLASQQIALQQRITASGQGSLAAATLNPQTIVPVSMAQSSISVSLAPVVSLHQNLPPACSLVQSLPQNLTMSAPTAALVSYPIVSQSMRSAVVHSSLAH